MIFFRKRLLLWLLREYLKRWGKTIVACFFIGGSVFFLLVRFGDVVATRIPLLQKESIGIAGSYTLASLPTVVTSQISRGLSVVSPDGTVRPDVASSWTIENDGKTYIVIVRPEVFYTDGERVRANTIHLSFTGVTIKTSKDKIIFTLKDPYSPFLATLSRPIFKKGFIGVGNYYIKHIKLNGDFIELLTLVARDNPYKSKTFHFYPSQDALKTAFVLGEVTTALGLSTVEFRQTTFAAFPRVRVEKKLRDNRLVTLFFNTKDAVLSDVKIRSALTYALPDSFSDGQRNYTPFAPTLWVSEGVRRERSQDLDRARTLLKQSQATPSATVFRLSTLPQYKHTAQRIANTWKDIGIQTSVEVVESVPSDFQVLLADFRVPKDPDQYTLWHKEQENNITRYANVRIDKLLEDGRKTHDEAIRRRIYSDFQKYLLADAPAAFLYFPYEYSITRK